MGKHSNRNEDDEHYESSYGVPYSAFYRGFRQSRYVSGGMREQCEREATRFYLEKRETRKTKLQRKRRLK